ncbi:MAG: metal-dependent transcriptional regulator, partial [Christensenellales bacterium]|nr:metal-dependent transcriptional regulator [Christensenellales bacterium]
MKIHESAENYLEAILVLSQNKTEVRSIDVANYMNFSKPSVSVAMKQLRQNGYIQMDANGFLTLLPPGREIA